MIPIEPGLGNSSVGNKCASIEVNPLLFNYLKLCLMKKIISVFALLLASSSAFSQSDSLSVYDLEEVAVISTRASKTTPMSYSDLKKSDLKAINFGQDVPQLLSLTPSVICTSDAGNGIGYTSIRVRGTDATRINVTANGIPINDAESNGVYWVNMPDFTSSVETMQIQRGVGTSTNGSGAFGATINMQTESIASQPVRGLDFSGGSYNSHKETLRFGTGLLHDHWGVQGRLSDIGSDGYIDRASTKLGSYFLQGGYFSDNTVVKFVTFNGKEETYHAWNYPSLAETDYYGRTYNSCGYMYTDDQGVDHYYENQKDYYHQQHYQLLWNQVINNQLNFNVALHYTKGQGYYEEYKRNRTLAEYTLTSDWSKTSDLIRQKKMDNDFFGAIASVNYDNKKGLSATLGGGWNKYIGDHFGNVLWVENFDEQLDPYAEYYNNRAKKVDGNIYGKLNYAFIPGLNGYLDLQYRHVGLTMNGLTDDWDWDTMEQINFNLKDSYDFFNPKVGVFCQVAKSNELYASFAVSHKEPTRNDYEDNLDTELKAERLLDWEAGYKFSSPTFSASANLYYMHYNDQFVLTGEINKIGEAIASNVGNSYRLGLELQAAWQPVKWFRWDVNATISKNRAKDWHVTDDVTGEDIELGDTPLAFSPDFIFNNILSFNHKGFRAAVQSQYVSDQYMSNTGFKSYTAESSAGDSEVSMMINGHFTTNLDLSYSFKLKGLKDISVGVMVYNLFNAKYMNNGWTAPGYKVNEAGKVVAYTTDDVYETGYAVSAPTNFMAHVSLNF